MTSELYRYTFVNEVPVEEIEATLLLSLFAAESLFGESRVRLDLAHHLDKEQRACVIDAGTPVGRGFNRLFIGFVSREFGADAFQVERIADIPAGRCREIVAAV
jgi:hypothetical protein